MVKIVKNPGNGRLNDLNDPVLNVLSYICMPSDGTVWFIKLPPVPKMCKLLLHPNDAT